MTMEGNANGTQQESDDVRRMTKYLFYRRRNNTSYYFENIIYYKYGKKCPNIGTVANSNWKLVERGNQIQQKCTSLIQPPIDPWYRSVLNVHTYLYHCVLGLRSLYHSHEKVTFAESHPIYCSETCSYVVNIVEIMLTLTETAKNLSMQ